MNQMDNLDLSTISTPSLHALIRAVVGLSVYDPEKWKKNFQAAVTAHIPPTWLYEAVLQSYLFLGYPSGLEGLRMLAEVIEINEVHAYERWSEHATTWQERGEETAQKVYRHHVHTLVSRLKSVTPELSEWMIVEGYGKVIGRKELPLPVRELLIAAILGQGTFIRQFDAHLHGCRNVGTPSDWLIAWFSERNALSKTAQPIWEKFREKYLVLS